MACCRFSRGVNVELKWGAYHLREFAMFAIVEDSVLVVRDDPCFQLLNGPLLIDVEAFRGGGEGNQGVEDSNRPILCALCCTGCGVCQWAWAVVSKSLCPAT